MRKLIPLVLLAPSAWAGPQINGSQINPVTSITISSITATSAALIGSPGNPTGTLVVKSTSTNTLTPAMAVQMNSGVPVLQVTSGNRTIVGQTDANTVPVAAFTIAGAPGYSDPNTGASVAPILVLKDTTSLNAGQWEFFPYWNANDKNFLLSQGSSGGSIYLGGSALDPVGIGFNTPTLSGGTLVVQSTSTTSGNPIADFRNNSGTSVLKATQGGAVVASGNVGIGTASPGATVDVLANSAGALVGQFVNTSATGYGVRMRAGTGASGNYVLSLEDKNNTVHHQFLDTGEVHLGVGGGNTGIGTASPGTNLSVQTAATNSTQVTASRLVNPASGTGVGACQELGFADNPSSSVKSCEYWSGTGRAIQWFTEVGAGVGPSLGMTLDENHRLGIGTASPQQKLHMSSGTFLLDGTSPGIQINNAANIGNPVTFWASASAAFNPGTITANSCVDSSGITITGAATGNLCAVGEATNAGVTGVIQTCRVSAANTVIVRACCSAGAGTCATTSQTYKVSIWAQ